MIKVILKDGGVYTIKKEQVELWKMLYPGVDVEQELGTLKEMWTENAIPRKTAKSINKFINKHLKEQEKLWKKKY
jgi:DNA primase large subunit